MTLLERDERMREEGRAEGREEGRAEGEIIGSIQLYHDELKMDSSQIIEKIMARFSLERAVAEKYVTEALDLQTV